MQIEKHTDKITLKNIDLDIAKTLECGQIFRYFKNGEEDYFVCSKDKRCRIIGNNEKIEIISNDADYFYNYFDLETDYNDIFEKLSKFPELTEALNFGKGIRILRQDLYETIISFIISANNNIPRIKGIIERLCSGYGKNCGEYFAFPTVNELRDVTIEDYRRFGSGFRDKYLYGTIRTLLQDDIINSLKNVDTLQARKILCSLDGVGPKVADCIILFGLSRFDTYPVDTWVFKACKNEVLNTPAKVMKYYLERYGNLAGYAQQYIFFRQRYKR